MRYYIVFFILFFHISNVSLSQSDFRAGYIVTNNYDSIFGLIDYTVPTSNSKFCFFKNSYNEEIVKYAPNDILAYGFTNDNQYVSKNIPFKNDSLRVFLEFLVNGEIDLFYYPFNGSSYYYLEKNGEIYQLDNEEVIFKRENMVYATENSHFIGRLKWILSDSDLSATAIEQTKFSHKSLTKITKKYHESVCEDEECIVYYKTKQVDNNARWRINGGLSFGNSWANVNLQTTTYNEGTKFSYVLDGGLYFHTFKTLETNASLDQMVSTVLPGLYFNISRNRRVSFQFELQYQKLTLENIEFKKIYVPIIINYDLTSHKKFIPYLNIGTYLNIDLGTSFNDLYINYEETVNLTPMGFLRSSGLDFLEYPQSQIISEEFYDTQMNKEINGINMIFGGGGKYQLSKKSILKLEFRYMSNSEKMITNLINAPGAESTVKIKSYSALLSFQYTIL